MTHDDSDDDLPLDDTLAPDATVEEDEGLSESDGESDRDGPGREEASEEDSEQGERRGETRQSNADTVRIKLSTGDLLGRIENLSGGGLFLVLDEKMRVEVSFDAEVGVEPRAAYLVRCQSLPGGKSGWGIQFESTDEED